MAPRPWERPLNTLPEGMRLAAARGIAEKAMPYFSDGLQQLVPRPAPGLGSMAVTDKSILLYDLEAMGRWTIEEAGSVYLHEYLHRYFRHDRRIKALVAQGVLSQTQEDFRLANEAADCEINDNLEEAGMPLPKGPNGEEPCTPKGMGLTPNLTFEAYVVELLKKRRAGQYTPNGSAPSAAGAGACGSGGGLPAPNEPAEDDPDGRDDVDQDVSNQAASEAIDKHQRAKGKGSVPAGLARHAQAALEPAKVDWREVVRRAVCSVVEVRAGLAEYSRRRISRRQWGVGIDDDAPVLPGMVAARAEVAVVADTSGSMWGALEEAWGEVAGLLDAIDGAQVTYVACDAKVHAVLKTSSIEEVKQHTKGGGGTDFRPAFRELDERKADLIVFITDGYGDYPDEVPAADVLWVVVPGGEISVDWGERVAISADGRT